ncbi:MAG: DnaD domain protein, partial [Lachnospiraceae bacterium]|nr:DnaD domain protein [Lachnospiraceae bacterium]
ANSGRELSVSSIADVFEHTEKDVQRALVYWEKQNLLRICMTRDGAFESVTFTDPASYSTPVILTEEIRTSAGLYSDGIGMYGDVGEEPEAAAERAADEKNASRLGGAMETPHRIRSAAERAADEKNASRLGGAALNLQEAPGRQNTSNEQTSMLGDLSASAQQDLRGLFLVAEQYLQRPLSASEQKDFVYYYHTLGFSVDLIEYLLEYCITRGTTSRHYMRKVAQGWAEAGITTVQEAKKESSLYNRNYFTIMKAFGLKGRNPAPSEQEMMERWLSELGLSMELILEACRRTIDQTHEANFKYADSILEQWHEAHIHTMKDVEEADRKWEQKQAEKKASDSKRKQGAANRFNNFPQRNYNYDSLEKKLFGGQ